MFITYFSPVLFCVWWPGLSPSLSSAWAPLTRRRRLANEQSLLPTPLPAHLLSRLFKGKRETGNEGHEKRRKQPPSQNTHGTGGKATLAIWRLQSIHAPPFPKFQTSPPLPPPLLLPPPPLLLLLRLLFLFVLAARDGSDKGGDLGSSSLVCMCMIQIFRKRARAYAFS